MDFSTHCCKRRRLGERVLHACVGVFVRAALGFAIAAAAVVAHAQNATQISEIRVERVEDEILLTAQLQFEVSSAVEEALIKGIPMVFVAEAELLRERWYWYDKKIQTVQRHARLAYQPLTRRWRVNVSQGPGSDAPAGLSLNQSFDTLEQAMAVIQRMARWKLAQASELDASLKYRVEFRFRLDLTQLPRPFQIGAIGQSEWDLSAAATLPLAREPGK